MNKSYLNRDRGTGVDRDKVSRSKGSLEPVFGRDTTFRGLHQYLPHFADGI